jgi:hypothetical protein
VPDEEVDEAKTFHPNVDEDDPEIVFERGRIFKPKNVNMAGTKKLGMSYPHFFILKHF